MAQFWSNFGLFYASGGDASEIFREVEHSPSAHIWLREFMIGTLADEEKAFSEEMTAK